MKTPQLLTASALVAVVMTGAACNRSEPNPRTERTTDQVKAAAARAKDQFADSWLTTKIQAQYFADDDIKARHINVSTRDGIVTLTGFVDSEAERQQAVQTARNTDGVKQVNDQLGQRGTPGETSPVATSGTIVEPGTPGPPSAALPPAPVVDDAQLTAQVQSRIFADDRLKGRQINVESHNAIITVSGEVASETERSQALVLARTTDGVSRVEDHLTVNVSMAPPIESEPSAAPVVVDDAAVMTTIQAKYFVDPTIKESEIDVSVKDGVVLLQGTVPDAAARQRAIAIARNSQGVLQVVDRLTIAPTR
jgi:hyperosmotically inducible protein